MIIQPYFSVSRLKNINQKNKPSFDYSFNHEKYSINYVYPKNFYINFQGNNNVNLVDFSKDTELKFINLLTADEPKSHITQSTIEKINNQFEKDNIGRIIQPCFSLNMALNYLQKKGQIKFSSNQNSNAAIFIDSYTLSWLKKNPDIANKIINSNTRFYCVVSNKYEQSLLLDDYKNIAESTDNITVINAEDENLDLLYPTSDEIKKIIENLILEKKGIASVDNVILKKALCKYVDNFMMPFSYQSLAKKTKEQHKLIQQSVENLGYSMDEVRYIIPDVSKSYALISYLYATENNIPENRFISLKHIKKANYKKDKVFVILDDFSSTGNSLAAATYILKLKVGSDKDVVAAPVVGTKLAKQQIYELDKEYSSPENGKIIYAPLISFDFNETSVDENFMDKNNIMSNSDKEIITQNYDCGWNDMSTSVIFPYIIPDTSSEITAKFAPYFIKEINEESNKTKFEVAKL